ALGCIIQGLSAQSLGETVYKKRCAPCHEQTNPRIPPRDSLQKMPASRILSTLDFGAMMTIAYPMRRDEREAVAAYLGTAGAAPGPPAAAFCSDRRVTLSNPSKFAWNGWSPAAGNARFQSSDAAGLTIGQVRLLKLKWAFGFDGDVTAFSQP